MSAFGTLKCGKLLCPVLWARESITLHNQGAQISEHHSMNRQEICCKWATWFLVDKKGNTHGGSDDVQNTRNTWNNQDTWNTRKSIAYRHSPAVLHSLFDIQNILFYRYCVDIHACVCGLYPPPGHHLFYRSTRRHITMSPLSIQSPLCLLTKHFLSWSKLCIHLFPSSSACQLCLLSHGHWYHWHTFSDLDV